MGTVAIVGAGFIGRAWTVVFARAGWQVRVTDPSAEVRREFPALVRRLLGDLAEYDLVRDIEAIAARVQVFDTVAEAVSGVDFVQENGPEQVDVKRQIFGELDRLTPPDAIIASSSSAIVASRFTEDLPGRARCLIGHPVNPPHLVPVVELCGAPWTSPEVIARARAVYESVDQVPVTIHREIEGFVLNRLQGALLTEAFRLVEDGVISPQDLDHTIGDGLGLRWSFMGPFQTIELNAPGGIPDYTKRYTGFLGAVAANPAPVTVWDEANLAKALAAWGETPSPESLKAKGAWRDRRLAALMAHRKSQDKAPGGAQGS